MSTPSPVGGVLDDTSDARLLLHPPFSTCSALDERSSVSILSWNIAVAQRSNLDEVFAVLEEADADVVLLQEVDVETERSGGVNQAEWLAERLGMSSFRHAG